MRFFQTLAAVIGLAAIYAAQPALAQETAEPAAKAPAQEPEAAPETRGSLAILTSDEAMSQLVYDAIAAGAGAPYIGPALTAADVNAWLDGFIPYVLDSKDIAGAVVTVVKDGAILANRGYGYADVAAGTPVDPDATLFRPGSISKLFTWTAVMQLKEQGLLDLDADVNDYLDFTLPAPRGTITIRHLMTHSPGFQETVKDLFVEGQAIGDERLRDYLVNHIPPQIFDAGTTPAYTNYGTALAGYIVERLSGEPIAAYIENHIFTPLGMTRSSFRQPLPPGLIGDMSKGYKTRFEGEAQPYEVVVPAPAGALAATGADMARFMIAHLNGGAGLMQSETAREMHTTLDNQYPPLNGFALGFYRVDRNGQTIISHGGNTEFFHSDLYLFLDHNVGLYVSWNSVGGGNGGPLRGPLLAGFTDRYFPAETSAPAAQPTAREHGTLAAGLYEVSRGAETNALALARYASQMTVSVDEDGILTVPFVRDFAGNAVRLTEVAPFVWQGPEGRRIVARVEDGRVTALAGEPAIFAFTPVPWYRSSAWLNPAIGAAVLVLAVTFIAWPWRAVARRRYKRVSPFSGARLWAYRMGPLAAILVLGWGIAWMMFADWLGASIFHIDSTRSESPMLMLYVAGILPVGALAMMLWAVRTVYTDHRSKWGSRLGSGLVLLSVLTVIWFGAVTGLFSFDTNF